MDSTNRNYRKCQSCVSISTVFLPLHTPLQFDSFTSFLVLLLNYEKDSSNNYGQQFESFSTNISQYVPGPGLGQSINPGPGLGQSIKPGPGLGQSINPGPGLGQSINPGPGLGQSIKPGPGLGQSINPGPGLGQSIKSDGVKSVSYFMFINLFFFSR